ncbi:MAG: EexN family lipoprotein [Candidatus Accumulibacter sp.]|nr:EexN family lipoprotein [Accumulibacter sp.]
MKKLALISLLLILSACSEKVYTVEEFMANRALMEDINKKCSGNPGKLEGTPNCVNAEKAKSMLFMCREFKRTDQECIERAKQRLGKKQ